MLVLSRVASGAMRSAGRSAIAPARILGESRSQLCA